MYSEKEFTMRTIGLAFIILAVLVSGTATAQVAAPRLNPLGISTGQPVNPAVENWRPASTIGAGPIQLDLEFTAPGSPPITASGDGASVQVALVGESIAFAAQSDTFEFEVDPPFGPANFESNATYAALGLRVGEIFSLGVGQQTNEEIEPNRTLSSTLPLGGAVLKLGESFYLGGAIGVDTFELEPLGGTAVEGERNVNRAGIGFYRRNNDGGIHLEAYVETTDVLEVTDAANLPVFVEDSETAGATVEFLFGDFLVGFELFQHNFTRVDGGVAEDKEEENSFVSIGYVPVEGLNIVGTVVSVEETNVLNGEVNKIDGVFLGIGYSF